MIRYSQIDLLYNIFPKFSTPLWNFFTFGVNLVRITGIICEYDPLHLGHEKQLRIVRERHPQGIIVCCMSGDFVQRGKPAIFDKSLRAQAALRSGADLVIQLPVTASLSSAEGFALEAVRILGRFCNELSFGVESGSAEQFMQTAQSLSEPSFQILLRKHLDKGLSFPAARQAALKDFGGDISLIQSSNNILGVEYCKAIIQTGTAMIPVPHIRTGNYHEINADPSNPSATAVRARILSDDSWLQYIPSAAHSILENAKVHHIQYGEKAILAVLRTMSEEAFSVVPYGTEGLWRKLMSSCKSQSTLEQIVQAVKSKRYTRSRLDRMIMCAFLGLTQEDLAIPAPYCRVLAFNDAGRNVLNQFKSSESFINIGQRTDHPYQALEDRTTSLYGLFAKDIPDPPDAEKHRRVIYERSGSHDSQ